MSKENTKKMFTLNFDNLESDVLEAQSEPNITEDKKIKKQTHYQFNQNQVFKEKKDALAYLEKNKNLYLFARDLTAKGAKEFIATTRDEILTATITTKHSHLYESYERGQPIKLMLDIDYKLTETTSKKIKFDDLVNKCITAVFYIFEHI